MTPEEDALAAVLDQIQDSLRDRVLAGLSTLDSRPESWGFSGARSARVVQALRAARAATTARSPSFLECGSGLGFIAALAREVGFTVTGIEVAPSYIEMSRRFFPAVRIEEADLLTFDRFGAFDVVYYYGPFADDAVQATFERRIEADLEPGGIIIAARKVTEDWKSSATFERLSAPDAFHLLLRKRVAS